MRLRYTGSAPTTFMHPGVGEVAPDGEFDVPDADADGFLARPDVGAAAEASTPEVRVEPAAGPKSTKTAAVKVRALPAAGTAPSE